MRCLDSDILISLLRGDKEAEKVIDRLDKEGVAITAVNSFELSLGCFLSNKPERIEVVKRLINSYIFLNFEKDASIMAGKIVARLEKKGQRIDWRDCMIAAIAIVNGSSIITRNVKDFSRIEGLKIERW